MILKSEQKVVNSIASNEYHSAVFGMFHVAFVDNKDEYFLPVEDRDSIVAALEFYKDRILKRRSYPVYDGQYFVNRPSDDKEVLFQVLGLPDVINERLDNNLDILSQLSFKDNLKALKKDSYIQLCSSLDKKWFSDDFKMYCLSHGVFFLYDETKPFIDNNNSYLPVFINEDKLDSDIKEFYNSFSMERLCVDFMTNDYNEDFVDIGRRLDVFSLDRQISYFINQDYDKELADIGSDSIFFSKYAKLLRKYIASLINALYDKYCLTVLNKLTTKTSYLTHNKIYIDRDLYCVSSYQGEMFSTDNKKFAFASSDKKDIKNSFSYLIDKYSNKDILKIYTLSGLPYFGYEYIKDLTDFTSEDIIKTLPFIDISESEAVISCKRYEPLYSYLAEEKEHQLVLVIRYLYSKGVYLYPVRVLVENDTKSPFTVETMPDIKDEQLSRLLDGKISLYDDILQSYFIYKKELFDSKLAEKIKKLDSVSCLECASKFFSLLKHRSIDDALHSLLSYYDLASLYDIELLNFFNYLLSYLYIYSKADFRNKVSKSNNRYILKSIDSEKNADETYEPSLPLPYVYRGNIAYSFRKTMFSTPYLCSCQKKAIEARYYHYKKEFLNNAPKGNTNNIYSLNQYIIDHLGLPDNIKTTLDFGRDILPQLKYRDKICHLCQNSEPTSFMAIDGFHAEKYNTYSIYIKAEAGKHGLFYDKLTPNGMETLQVLKELRFNEFESLISVDKDKVDPIIKPFIKFDKKGLASIISFFSYQTAGYFDFVYDLNNFLSLDMDTINDFIFDFYDDLVVDISQNTRMFASLSLIYRRLEKAYAFYCSKEIVSYNNLAQCMNVDYNPRLPYPYVLLGNIFNAYTNDIEKGEFYFCQCDYKAIKNVLDVMLNTFNESKFPLEYRTPIVLAISGLPLQVILKYRNFDFSEKSSTDFVKQLKFRDSICRKCTNISHCSYGSPFMKAFPLSNTGTAEAVFAQEEMIKDRFFLITDGSFDSFVSMKDLSMNIDSYTSPLFPTIYCFDDKIPLPVFNTFTFNNISFDEIVEELKKMNFNEEALAVTIGVIKDTLIQNDKVFCKTIVYYDGSVILKDYIMKYFTQIERVRDELKNQSIEIIITIIYLLYKYLIKQYMDKERMIGR